MLGAKAKSTSESKGTWTQNVIRIVVLRIGIAFEQKKPNRI